jgi:hypothetical protein
LVLHRFCVVFEGKDFPGGSGGEGLAKVEGRGGDGDVAVLHDPEPFLSYQSYLEFCAGAQ